MENKIKKPQRLYIGEVVSDKMDKTCVVKIEQRFKDRQFHKIRRRTKKYKVHDEQNQAKIGDTIEFHEGIPKSKMKYMYLSRVINT